jgi:aminoglycoside phosphotransferase (APT) family kinase protein
MHGQRDVTETAAYSRTTNVLPPLSLVQDLAAASLVPRTAIWQSLCGGRTNQVWLVQTDTSEHVVKLYAPAAATPLFSNDPQAEALVLGALSATGLSPRPLFSGILSAGPVLIYDHQQGKPWQSDPQPVASALKMLHNFPDSSELAQLPLAPDGSAELASQTMAMLAQIPSALAEPIVARRPKGQIPPSGHRALLHGDPVPGNLICRTDKALPVLVDWQCPALGDPVMDLALFLSPAMQHVGRAQVLSDQERDSFLATYDDPAVINRLHALQPFLHWRMAAYCLWKTTRPMPDPAYASALAQELAALARVTT